MDKIKSLLWFAGKVVLSLAVLNFVTKTLLGTSVAMLIEYPIETVTGALGKVTSKVSGT
jgi:hypothetical protein